MTFCLNLIRKNKTSYHTLFLQAGMKFQTKFDAETDHGANIEMQNIYDKIIEEMLNSCNWSYIFY